MAVLLAAALALYAFPTRAAPAPWWRGATIYEIYPRSFQDSDGDGVGDLRGIASRLDYLQQLGVDAFWLAPIFPSPQVDFGYDVSDFTAIDPRYGTMADFDALVAAAKRRHIRVILDFVLNHTSDKHRWFVASRSSRADPKRDWYVWADGRGAGPPNNWTDGHGHAWTYDAPTKQWYYHAYAPEQPDLNWRNPRVRAAMGDVARFWMARGVAGFRLDTVPTLIEDATLRDEPAERDASGGVKRNAAGEPTYGFTRWAFQPETHGALKGLRCVTDEYPGRVLIGEAYVNDVDELRPFYGQGDELQLPMAMHFGFTDKWDIAAFRRAIAGLETLPPGDEPLIVFGNHDQPRWDRFGKDPRQAYVIATMLLASRGTALLYEGDEIGMRTWVPQRREDVRDPVGIRGWPKDKGRDGSRTPMQWSAAVGAGFTNGTPWLPIGADYLSRNVEAQARDPASLLSWHKRLIALRRTNAAMREGATTLVGAADPNVLAWVRRAPGHSAVLVATNLTDKPAALHLAPGEAERARTLMATAPTPAEIDAGTLVLAPFGVFIGEMQR